MTRWKHKMFCFGKYSGENIRHIKDLQYLEWYIANVTLVNKHPTIKREIERQINYLKEKQHYE